jgi:DNA-binding transcriptional LysR family regulator
MTVSLSVDMRHIRAFLTVSNHGSFTRAAQEIGLSQPALTICIRQLEENLGLHVFSRTTRRVTLTPAGEEFLPVAQRLMRDFDGALSMLKAHADVQRGQISVACLPSIASEWLPPIISSFARSFPQVGITIVSESSPAIVRLLRTHEVNFGFVGLPYAERDMVAKEIHAEPIHLVCPRDHPLATGSRPLRWIDLLGHEFLDPGNEDCIRTVVTAVPALAQTLSGARYRANKAAILAAMLCEGIGVTAMPLLAVPREYRAKLAFRQLSEPVVYRRIYLLTRRDHLMSPAEQRFIEDTLGLVQSRGRIPARREAGTEFSAALP